MTGVYVIDKLWHRKSWGLFYVTKEPDCTRYTPVAYFKSEELARDFAKAKCVQMPDKPTFKEA